MCELAAPESMFFYLVHFELSGVDGLFVSFFSGLFLWFFFFCGIFGGVLSN